MNPRRLGRTLFGPPGTAAPTLDIAAKLGWVVPPLWRWSSADATWVGRQPPRLRARRHLLGVLFIGLVLRPMMLPSGVTVDNLTRALVVSTPSTFAYIAEVTRGGLQGVPLRRREVAMALGLHPLQANVTVVLS